MSGRCAVCGQERAPGDAYCEDCGHGLQSPTGRWEAVVTADRPRFESLAPGGVTFPVDFAPWTMTLDDPSVVLDRQSLRGDPGISRTHAELVRRPDGYALVDHGSLNGTTVNDIAVSSTRPLLLHAGDRVQLGAWTTLTIRNVATEQADADD